MHGVGYGLTMQEVTITNRRAESQHTASEGLEYLLVGPVVARSGLMMNGKTTRARLAVGAPMRRRGGFQGVQEYRVSEWNPLLCIGLK